MSRLQIISGQSHPVLAQKIAKYLKIKLTPVEIKRFANGEIYVTIKENVRSDDVYLIQTFCPPVNENLIELLVTIDALKRASAGRINLVCPHLCYSRQDRKFVSREPITAKLVANLITTAGADRLITIDLHSDQIQGFYDIPVDHLIGYPKFAEYLLKKRYKNLAVVSPDIGGVRRGRKMAELLHAPIVIADKRRPQHNQAETLQIIGEVKNKTLVIIDDLIDTGGTIVSITSRLKQLGAKEIIICATHGLLSANAVEKLENCPASQILLLDTVPLPKKSQFKKLKVISVAKLLSKVIRRVHQGKSLGKLFTWEEKERKL